MHVRGIAAVQLLHGCVVSRARPPVENVRGRARWIVVHRTARHRRDIYILVLHRRARTAACAAAVGVRGRPPGPRLRFRGSGRPGAPQAQRPGLGLEGSGGEGPGAFGGPTPAGGGDSSNGRQPLRPTRNHRRGPAPCTAASGRRLKKKGCR
jgi:hypothetical protein